MEKLHAGTCSLLASRLSQSSGSPHSQAGRRVFQMDSFARKQNQADHFEARTIFVNAAVASLCGADAPGGQNRLRNLSPGDSLTLESGTTSNGEEMLFLRHRMGVIGGVKKSVLLEFSERFPDASVIVRIAQDTWGHDSKPLLNFTIALTCAPENEGQRVEEVLGPAANPRPRRNPSPDIQVYLDRTSGMFHIEEHCMGLKCATRMGLRMALYQFHAVPCASCGAEKLAHSLHAAAI